MTFYELFKPVPHQLLWLRQLMRVMKLTVFLMIFMIGNACAGAMAQRITMDKNNATLTQVFKQIRKQTTYNVVWSPQKVNEQILVNALFKDLPLDEVLKSVLSPQNLDYTIKNKTIVIHQKKNIPAIETKVVDTIIVVKGKVTDTKGMGLPGVSIKAKNGSASVVTDNDGQYTIKVNGNSVLVVFSIGFKSQEVAVNGRTTVNVQLLEDLQILNDVVIVGYGSQKRKDLATAVSSIKGEDIQNVPVATAQSLIQGRASGVQVVQNSGAPGSAVTVRIRGTTSINAGNDPLYIVDGVPVESGTLSSGSLSGSQTSALSAINADDIESMEVLKDAGALAIYGSRAANGVVLITTKHGKKGTTVFNFNVYTGLQKDNESTRVKLMDNQQSIELIQENRANALADGVTALYGFLLPAPDGTVGNTNWQNELFRTAPISNYEVSVRGGESKLRYAISGSYFDQDGIIINSGYKRGTGRLNLDYDASEKLKFGANFFASRYVNKRVATEDGANSVLQVALKKSPSMPVYNPDGSYFLNDVSGFINPVAFANKLKYENEVSSVVGNTYGELTIIPQLTLRATLGFNYANVIDEYFEPSDARRNGVATGSTFASRVDGWINENTLNYAKDFGKHRLSGVLGYSQQERTSYGITARGTNYATNNIYTLNAAVLPTEASSSTSGYGLSSAFGRIGYVYDDKYYLEATARRDGSSRFGLNKRYAIFPAASLAWRISNESFWDKTGKINDLKLRSSIGKTGNQTIGDYVAQGQYATGGGYGGQSGIFLSTIPNPDLTWETTLQYNLGLDISLFKSRISLSVDAYLKKTSNLLLDVPVPNTSGFGSILQNVGATENKGLEFGLNTVNVQTEKFDWTSNFNISFNRNKVTQLYSGAANIINSVGSGITGSLQSFGILQVGESIGSFYGWKNSGVYRFSSDNTAGIRNASAGTNGYLFKGGDMIFQDTNGNGTIDNEDRVIIGNALPKFTGGFTNALKYGRIDLNILMTFSYGNDILNGTRYSSESATGFVGSLTMLNRWRNEGDITSIPRANSADPAGNKRFSNRWLEDGSYLRAKNVTIGYQVPNNVLNKVKIKNARLYATAQNLFTFTKYTGYDPEASAFNTRVTEIGIDQGTYPQYRAYTFGLNIGL